jgi:DGQHR domain-containing protein
MDERAFEVTRFRQLYERRPVELFVGAVPAQVLVNLFEVDIHEPGSNPDGYQRRPAESRIRDITRYVLGREGVLPTAVLVNVRDDSWTFQPERPGSNRGLLKLPAAAKLWVVDGQHRVHGLKEALHEREASGEGLEYEVPVVFTVGFDRFKEMRLFHIVNSTAKAVPTDLAAHLLYEAVRKEGKSFVHQGKGKDKEFRRAVGTKIAYHLNSTPGPWQGRIRLPNESADRKRKPLQVNAVASSLDRFLSDPYVVSMYEPEREQEREWPTVRGIVHAYWRALEQLMPDAFADISSYTVQRTAGCYAFHYILADVVHRCREHGDFSVDTFKKVLSYLGEWVKAPTWHSEQGHILTRSTGMRAIRELADTMRRELPPLTTPGLSTEEEPVEKRAKRAAVVYGE